MTIATEVQVSGGWNGQGLGPDGVVEVGSISDARLGALAPTMPGPDSWWRSSADRDGGAGLGAADGPRPSREHLAIARSVLHEARVVVTWETDARRGAFVVAGETVLIDRIGDGRHHLTLADVSVAVTLLALGIDPLDLARHRSCEPDDARLVERAGLEAALPPDVARRSCIRLVRLAAGPPTTETVVTVIGTGDGISAWRALADGDVVVAPLDRDGVVAAALALIADGPAVVAA